jgi:hypothetical protein
MTQELSIKQATSADFPRVLPLLKKFRSGHLIDDETWQRLFTRKWEGSGKYCGLILQSGNEPVGFIHSLFSERIIGGKRFSFCNLGTWIVEPEFRSKSMSIFFPFMKLKKTTLTSFTANPRFIPILAGFKFSSLEDHISFLPPSISLNRQVQVLIDKENISKELSGESLRIFSDHKDLSCDHIVLDTPRGNCYLVLNPARKRRFPVAYLNYVSDLDLFLTYIHSASSRICSRLGVAALMIGAHTLKGKTLKGCIQVERKFKLWFRTDDLNAYDVDTLYSEYQVLGLKPT